MRTITHLGLSCLCGLWVTPSLPNGIGVLESASGYSFCSTLMAIFLFREWIE